MTNLPKLSNRSRKALDVLADGGTFVSRLERNGYTGREQWAYRLQQTGGSIVRGIGLASFYELKDLGFLVLASCTSVSSYYKLDQGTANRIEAERLLDDFSWVGSRHHY
jgi:hypothetical protein